MLQHPLQVLTVSGSTSHHSAVRALLAQIAAGLTQAGCQVDTLDLAQTPLPLLNPETTYKSPAYQPLRERVLAADVLLVGTPDYHGCMSGALKNFFDHFWQEFAGKLFASVVASHEKGLTVTDQIRTVARQCYAWSLPYGVSFEDKTDFNDGQILSDDFRHRLTMLERDLRVYGALLAAQRVADLAATDPGFLARARKK